MFKNIKLKNLVLPIFNLIYNLNWITALIKMVLDKPWSLSHKKPFSWAVTLSDFLHILLWCATHIAQGLPLQWVQRFQLLSSTASLGLRLQTLGNRKVNSPPQLPSQQPSRKTEIILHWDNPRICVLRHVPRFPLRIKL